MKMKPLLFDEITIGTTFEWKHQRVVKISNSYFFITNGSKMVNAMNEQTGELLLVPAGLMVVPVNSQQPAQPE